MVTVLFSLEAVAGERHHACSPKAASGRKNIKTKRTELPCGGDDGMGIEGPS